jgi:pyruvate dehydrogenase (quinone)
MTADPAGPGGLGRRSLFRLAGATGLSAAGAAPGYAAVSVPGASSGESAGPMDERTTADILVDAAIAAGATHAFGIVGDGINPVIQALWRRRDRIAFIGVRHEEAAAFMASGMAKHGGRLGVCVATTGPGAVHLLNGLFDAALDGAPVLAITGATFHDMDGMRYPQALDAVTLMREAALFNEKVSGPAHALLVADRACRAALDGRGVAHLTVAKDVQSWRLTDDHPSVPPHPVRPLSGWLPAEAVPPPAHLDAAASVLNAGRRVAILAGQGCLCATPQLERTADLLGAPVAKAFLGKALLPDDHPLTTGGIGHLGTLPSKQVMAECDTLLILGSTMPWTDYYPAIGQARCVQLDRRADRLGIRHPVEVGLVGDAAATLDALIPRLRRQPDRSFLEQAQARMRDWSALLRRVEATQHGSRLRPQAVVRAFGALAPPDALFSLDCGANTQFAARHIALKPGQGWTGCGTLVSMASGLPLAVAGAFAHPGRPSLAVVGDGGLAMLMAELSTAALHRLPVKVLVLNNDSLGQERFEQQAMGMAEYGCALGHIDFAAVAAAAGATGLRCARPDEVEPAIRRAFATPGPVVIDAIVDANERPTAPADLRA